MVKNIVFVLLLSFSIFSRTYTQDNLSRNELIDEYVSSTPDKFTHNVADLTEYLTSPYENEEDKVRAIYSWVANNLSYSLRKMRYQYTYSDQQEIVDDALKSRNCVCQGYAELFHALCSEAGIDSYVVSGYVKLDGKIEDFSHAWNAARVNGKWYLFDPTWGSGYVHNNRFYPSYNDNFYKIEPSKFIQSHMPFDPLWQFLSRPLTHKDFYFGAIPEFSAPFNFEDTLKIYYCKDCKDLQKRLAAYNRIVGNGIDNEMIQREVEQAMLNIAISLNNYAGELLNQSIDSYNLYVEAKNNSFKKPYLNISEAFDSLERSDAYLDEARNIFGTIQTKDKGLKNSLNKNLQIVNDLASNVKEEQRFLKKYKKQTGI
jgi:hypothetical protein